jgi:ferredoxin
MHDDGLAYVKEENWPSILDDGSGPKDAPIYQMGDGMAEIPEKLLEDAIEAADDCPGECIYIEP